MCNYSLAVTHKYRGFFATCWKENSFIRKSKYDKNPFIHKNKGKVTKYHNVNESLLLYGSVTERQIEKSRFCVFYNLI